MATPSPTCNVSCVGPRAIVTVNNGSGSGISQAGSHGYTSKGSTVTVTPLGPPRPSQITLTRSTPIGTHKLLIKVVEKGEKQTKDPGKIFTLRNVNPTSVSSMEGLKSLIRAQLADDIVDRFDIGYIHSNKIISLRSKEDVIELMSCVQKNDKILLWCNGLRKIVSEKRNPRKRKSKSVDNSDSDSCDDTPSTKVRKETRDDKVKCCIEELKEKHGQTTYTCMQYRIWAELLSGGVYSSTSEAPTHSTMFMRAGSGGIQKRKSHSTAQANSTPMLTPTSTSGSPARQIDNRSKCYKQLADLNSLKESGLLSEDEYATEREAILNMLKRLRN